MLNICLSKNVQKSKFHDLTHDWGEGVVKGRITLVKVQENEEIGENKSILAATIL